MNPFNGGWAVLLTLIVAMILGVAHFPEAWPGWLGLLRPNWVLVVLFFWVMELPHRIGLIAAWILGLLMDGLLGEPLGLNGFILAGTTYVAWRFFERLRMYSVLQQCGVVFLLAVGAEVMRVFVTGLASERQWGWQVLLVAVTSTIVWPFLYLVLLRLRIVVRVE